MKKIVRIKRNDLDGMWVISNQTNSTSSLKNDVVKIVPPKNSTENDKRYKDFRIPIEKYPKVKVRLKIKKYEVSN